MKSASNKIGGGKLKKKQGKYAALFLFPYLTIFFIFRLGPSIAGLFISLTNWKLASKPRFIKFDNFIKLFKDDYFYISVINTFKFFIIILPILICGSLLLALLLNQKMKFKNAARAISIIPYVLIPAVVGIMWTWLYDNNFGILNYYIKKLGGSTVYWLTDEKMAMLSVSIVVIWSYLGYNMVLFLAGLQGIPRELYEAAQIDGATKIKTFFKITLPLLSSVTSMVVTLTLVNVVQLFDQIFVMTKGGPGTATLTMVQYLYTSAFQNYNLGYGATVEVMVLIILAIMIFVQNKVLKTEER